MPVLFVETAADLREFPKTVALRIRNVPANVSIPPAPCGGAFRMIAETIVEFVTVFVPDPSTPSPPPRD